MFKRIARREGRTAGRILVEFIENYVLIHEPGNPQWPLERWAPPPEKSSDLAVKSERMPDYANMPDAQLLAVYRSPRTPDSDRQIIAFWLKKRGICTKAQSP